MMTDVVLRAEGLGKKYLIGHEASREQYTALRDVIGRAARDLTRSARDMLRGRQLVVGDEVEEYWALKDINFEIKRGEVVGIIGRNGAGKSTLLKILSRITEPSEGRVTIKGRVASLLEVGTGFHPELTGRENIFLNGAILGMTRAEIRRKFDEIVDFADIEKFLDTPVKRYSSGMYVRLAFAVAAHLEPEILIVDEVLAVGDAEFQKKCLGKMRDVAGHGRTVLFVSHNMGAVRQLCEFAYLLRGGHLVMTGTTDHVLPHYLESDDLGLLKDGVLSDVRRIGKGELRFRRVTIFDDDDRRLEKPIAGRPCRFVLEIEGTGKRGATRAGLGINDTLGRPLVVLANEASSNERIVIGSGDCLACRIDKMPLTEGRYALSLFLEVDGVIEDWVEDGLFIQVADGSFFGTPRNAPKGWNGRTVLVDHTWSVLTS